MNNLPVRVLHIVGNMNAGGMETFAMNLYRSVDRSKIQFDFVVHSDSKSFYEDEIKSLGGNVYRCTTMSSNLFKHMCDLSRIIKKNNYKVIHRHTASAVIVFDVISAKLSGVSSVIVHSHANKVNGKQKLLHNLLKFPLNLFSIVRFACSESAGKYMFLNRNFTLMKNAIDSHRFAFDYKIRNIKRANLNVEDRFVLGHVGRFVTVKNHSFLIDIFFEVLKKVNDSVLLLIGTGPFENGVREKVKKLKIEKNVIFLGVRSDINELMQAMDVFVCPSMFESLGIAVIEAQAAGLPCVVSDGVPSEAYVTDLVESISLKKGALYWADKILNCGALGRRRKNMQNEIESHGYDMKKVANWYEEFILSCL